MITKIESLLERFQGNAYPAMLDDLALHLGVSSDSLRRLALGWAPVVTFKKKVSYCGWWVIPERDADGQCTGLNLRNQQDAKTCYPGSSHGLIYEVNPKHSRGEHGYSSGAHNWVRTMDAGVLCPVCGKPDGCIVSSENPSDPKAVVCIRTKAGAVKPMKFGHLHIRKADGHLADASAMANNGGPLLVVEGMTDVAAALDMGFDGAGRPSNLACMDILADLARGRTAIVIGENDRKPDGKEPGREGMIAAFQTLKRVCRDVRMVMPPEHVKDLRAWKVKYGLTREKFLEFVEKEGQQHQVSTLIADDRPTTIARAFLDANYRMAGRYSLRRWESTWYRYGGSKYVPLKDEPFTKPLYDWAYDKSVQRESPKGITIAPLVANPTLVSAVSQAIMAETLIPNPTMPCWINGHNGPDPSDLIPFTNGILHVPAFLDGSSEFLLESTPDFFTTASLPFAFDATATCPTWFSFLNSSLGDEPEKSLLIQEWIGYCMTPDTRMDKMMFLRGPTCAGKSKVLNVLKALVGAEQTADTSFADLSGQFGIAPLVGKLICIIADARTPKGAATRGLELLLNISGSDSVQINRKFKDQIESHKLTARVTIASNEFLKVPDHAGALIRRMNIIEFQRSFIGREDFGLEAKLMKEIPGIAIWALEGLRRLRANGVFTVPPSSRSALMDMRTANSPVAAFLIECCEDRTGSEVTKNEIYDAWVGWCEAARIWACGKSPFFERVKMNATHVVFTGDRLKGVHLQPWAQKQFLGRPTR
jgi:putative DNA primase/helicase